ncbi:MAG: hypothetical protein F6K44_26445 [Moorea sp. SIO3E2]|uniref:hypothetical protein n=1 Tax=Moorena producens TaxID=1155739 RepID=UPI001056A711|nr:hypothetical protein [Moorena producens]NEP66783.1 hypothetical protein [Moorena sp. SIO3A5]NEQ17097.1 hypothetical protein [Moorena sp. SIO3E2]
MRLLRQPLRSLEMRLAVGHATRSHPEYWECDLFFALLSLANWVSVIATPMPPMLSFSKVFPSPIRLRS